MQQDTGVPDTPGEKVERVVFRGHVQGVGFRWTTREVAQRHGVRGWVRNLPDGSVEMVAAASPHILGQFMEDLQTQMSGHIREHHRQTWTLEKACDGFEIRH